jgi:hypothetical protein
LALAVVADGLRSNGPNSAASWSTRHCGVDHSSVRAIGEVLIAVRRLPDPLTATACAGTAALLAVAAFISHQPAHLGRAAVGGAALTCF